MSLAKEAQFSEETPDIADINLSMDMDGDVYEGVDTPSGMDPEEQPEMAEADDIEIADELEADDTEADIEVSQSADDVDEARFLIFDMENVPGALHQEDIQSEIEVEEPEEDIEVEERDPWDWQSQGLGKFLPWIHEKMHNVPGHSGYDTTGLERAIAYFEVLDKEMSKAMRMDFKNEIDVAKAEEAREQIENGLERMVDRLEKVKTTKYKRHAKKGKNKKKAEADDSLVKTSQKITGVEGRIHVTVPLFISGLARVCINGMVSAGHDLEDLFHKMSKQYNLDDRQKFELVTLISDMGYVVRRDRGSKLDSEFKYYSSDNADWSAQYPG